MPTLAAQEDINHMSEKLQSSGEQLPSVEVSAESEKNLGRLREAAKQAEKDPIQKHVESLQKSVEAQAISGKELNVGDRQGENSNQSFGVQKELKADAYKRTLRKVQSNLPVPARVFSKVVHQPVIDAISSVAGKTIARPSAFLGGSFFALLGSAVLLYMTKNYGFTYNYAVIFMLFVGGFAVGLVLELLLRVVLRRKAS